MIALWVALTIALGALWLAIAGLALAALVRRKRTDRLVGRIVAETRQELRNGRH